MFSLIFAACIAPGLGPLTAAAAAAPLPVTRMVQEDGTPGATGGRPPSLVVVLADDLGWGDIGCQGQEKILTPWIDRMAAEGMRFSAGYAGSTVCAPSRSVLMTGMHAGHTRVRGNRRVPLRDEDVTVAEVLKGQGYRTALFGKWGLGNAGSSGHPVRQGFERFFGFSDQLHAHNSYPPHLWDGEQRVELSNVVPGEGKWGQGKASERHDWAPARIHREAMGWLRSISDDEPFFLYLASTIPHANNEAGSDGMEVPELGVYADRPWPRRQREHAAMVSALDRQVGELLETLASMGRDEDTLVIFLSDNGPHREGGNDPDFADSNGPYRGIKRALTEGGIRVPFIARWPGTFEAGVVNDSPVHFQDLFATAGALAGAEVPAGLDSRDLLPTLRGASPPPSTPLYWEFHERGSAEAVRFGRWKAIRSPMQTGSIRLFDLTDDPGEDRDLALGPDYTERVQEAARYMDAAHLPSAEFKTPAER
ncbi:arylsulfatase [bacterium]|nr:arylsulfatase [bacterium]